MESTSQAKLAAALVAAQGECGAVGKSGENKFDHYDYATLNDYMTAVRPILMKHGLAVSVSIDKVENLPDRTTQKGGTERVVRVTGTMAILHTSGESITVNIAGDGQDRGDKAIYKAITGARKYGIAAAFALATSDDPENDASKNGKPVPTNGVNPAMQPFIDTYEGLMADRGCPAGKAAPILMNALKKKRVSLNSLSEESQQKILEGVKSGQWDKFFKA